MAIVRVKSYNMCLIYLLLGHDYIRQTTPNQEALVIALLKWYFLKKAEDTADGEVQLKLNVI